MAQRILVVNDTEEILETFRDLLEEEGFEVITYSFAPHEIEDVQRAQPDLIIVDFMMGGYEQLGWQLIQKLKMSRATADIAVVICTGALREVREQEGYLHAQNIDVVFKPFDIDHLLATIRRALDGRRTALLALENSPAEHGTEGPASALDVPKDAAGTPGQREPDRES